MTTFSSADSSATSSTGSLTNTIPQCLKTSSCLPISMCLFGDGVKANLCDTDGWLELYNELKGAEKIDNYSNGINGINSNFQSGSIFNHSIQLSVNEFGESSQLIPQGRRRRLTPTSINSSLSSHNIIDDHYEDIVNERKCRIIRKHFQTYLTSQMDGFELSKFISLYISILFQSPLTLVLFKDDEVNELTGVFPTKGTWSSILPSVITSKWIDYKSSCNHKTHRCSHEKISVRSFEKEVKNLTSDTFVTNQDLIGYKFNEISQFDKENACRDTIILHNGDEFISDSISFDINNQKVGSFSNGDACISESVCNTNNDLERDYCSKHSNSLAYNYRCSCTSTISNNIPQISHVFPKKYGDGFVLRNLTDDLIHPVSTSLSLPIKSKIFSRLSRRATFPPSSAMRYFDGKDFDNSNLLGGDYPQEDMNNSSSNIEYDILKFSLNNKSFLNQIFTQGLKQHFHYFNFSPQVCCYILKSIYKLSDEISPNCGVSDIAIYNQINGMYTNSDFINSSPDDIFGLYFYKKLKYIHQLPCDIALATQCPICCLNCKDNSELEKNNYSNINQNSITYGKGYSITKSKANCPNYHKSLNMKIPYLQSPDISKNSYKIDKDVKNLRISHENNLIETSGNILLMENLGIRRDSSNKIFNKIDNTIDTECLGSNNFIKNTDNLLNINIHSDSLDKHDIEQNNNNFVYNTCTAEYEKELKIIKEFSEISDCPVIKVSPPSIYSDSSKCCICDSYPLFTAYRYQDDNIFGDEGYKDLFKGNKSLSCYYQRYSNCKIPLISCTIVDPRNLVDHFNDQQHDFLNNFVQISRNSHLPSRDLKAASSYQNKKSNIHLSNAIALVICLQPQNPNILLLKNLVEEIQILVALFLEQKRSIISLNHLYVCYEVHRWIFRPLLDYKKILLMENGNWEAAQKVLTRLSDFLQKLTPTQLVLVYVVEYFHKELVCIVGPKALIGYRISSDDPVMHSVLTERRIICCGDQESVDKLPLSLSNIIESLITPFKMTNSVAIPIYSPNESVNIVVQLVNRLKLFGIGQISDILRKENRKKKVLQNHLNMGLMNRTNVVSGFSFLAHRTSLRSQRFGTRNNGLTVIKDMTSDLDYNSNISSGVSSSSSFGSLQSFLMHDNALNSYYTNYMNNGKRNSTNLSISVKYSESDLHKSYDIFAKSSSYMSSPFSSSSYPTNSGQSGNSLSIDNNILYDTVNIITNFSPLDINLYNTITREISLEFGTQIMMLNMHLFYCSMRHKNKRGSNNNQIIRAIRNDIGFNSNIASSTFKSSIPSVISQSTSKRCHYNSNTEKNSAYNGNNDSLINERRGSFIISNDYISDEEITCNVSSEKYLGNSSSLTYEHISGIPTGNETHGILYNEFNFKNKDIKKEVLEDNNNEQYIVENEDVKDDILGIKCGFTIYDSKLEYKRVLSGRLDMYREWGLPLWSHRWEIHRQFLLDIFCFFDFDKIWNWEHTKLLKLFDAIKDSYNSNNPYHNIFHAIQVVQVSYILLYDYGLMHVFSNIQKLVLIFSSLVHDIDHPGVNNSFLKSTNSKLARKYNDVSILENHHCNYTLRLLDHLQDCDIRKSFNEQENIYFRKLLIQAILSTDMSNHTRLISILEEFLSNRELTYEVIDNNRNVDLSHSNLELIRSEHVNNIKLVNKYYNSNLSGDKDDYKSYKRNSTLLNKSLICSDNNDICNINIVSSALLEIDKDLLVEVILHAADISNPLCPSPICYQWASLIQDEFNSQALLEYQCNLPITPYANFKDEISKVDMQIGFLEFAVIPQWRVLSKIIPATSKLLGKAEQSRIIWLEKRQKIKEYKDKDKDYSDIPMEKQSYQDKLQNNILFDFNLDTLKKYTISGYEVLGNTNNSKYKFFACEKYYDIDNRTSTNLESLSVSNKGIEVNDITTKILLIYDLFNI
ncbi:3', 5'-cyclic nucleotide phosphodiesterase domain-containing protein [Cryptosporidium muris RN66]|uniref:Phosphodiesterase n=1 Tax=Cryptosporidium muris (strain RN66) TaxID=441375 RepID=B6ABL1_CRYMR|nr:3', 5'-cyclic nucleotide phosphodiesterase domain-containing protein [Cryptosporidium muris RN66]EEA05763.1 3', 5'-cyclic nucleotide phosphodiesterase domain-containing protein [Cryptosporidium muris RN66]|eukprot:XP_002140112.1 3', 5'-cyclic nucleotide phosphodiesterase domain-containing protein [Cryptosporidium muris RN66]